MFARVKSADTPIIPTKKSSNASVSTSSLRIPSIKSIVYVVLVCKRWVGGEN
jgi:hypothetical protein